MHDAETVAQTCTQGLTPYQSSSERSPRPEFGSMEYFCCDICNDMRPLDALLDLDCSCSVCSTCCIELIRPCLVPAVAAEALAPAATEYDLGELVRYKQRDGSYCSAKVVQIDRSIQPWGYGIQLEGNVDVRFTEHTRLLPKQPSSQCLQQGFPVVRCPRCQVVLTRAQLARILPDALQQLDKALNNIWLESKGIIRCPAPGCEALIEKLPAATNSSSQSMCTCNRPNNNRCTTGGSTCSSCQEQHKALHRYRCTLCSNSFCDSCRTVPYHEGLTCREAAAPCCPFCEARVPEALDIATAGLSSKQLRDAVNRLGADCSWCLERTELVSVYKRAKQVCRSCRPQLAEMCTRQLPCGHFCCGVREDPHCLPCLVQGCSSQVGVAGDGTCCFCWEPLVCGAVVALTCDAGHYVHLRCARQRLQVGCPGPALTFDFLFCPLCGSGKDGRCGNIQVITAQPHLQHAQLQAALERPLQLRQQVVHLAKQRLRLTSAAKQDGDLQPGGKFDGRPVDWMLSKYMFFECSKCHLPYFGGARTCGAGLQQAAARAEPAPFDAQELVCGSCSAAASGSNCKQHGTEFVAWKCKYCCDVASWFCWGSTHMCSRCHDNPGQRYGHTCPGPGRCTLAVPHPPPGQSCCLGCEACRHREGF